MQTERLVGQPMWIEKLPKNKRAYQKEKATIRASEMLEMFTLRIERWTLNAGYIFLGYFGDQRGLSTSTYVVSDMSRMYVDLSEYVDATMPSPYSYRPTAHADRSGYYQSWLSALHTLQTPYPPSHCTTPIIASVAVASCIISFSFSLHSCLRLPWYYYRLCRLLINCTAIVAH